jgi:hypothetical protein
MSPLLELVGRAHSLQASSTQLLHDNKTGVHNRARRAGVSWVAAEVKRDKECCLLSSLFPNPHRAVTSRHYQAVCIRGSLKQPRELKFGRNDGTEPGSTQFSSRAQLVGSSSEGKWAFKDMDDFNNSEYGTATGKGGVSRPSNIGSKPSRACGARVSVMRNPMEQHREDHDSNSYEIDE